MTGCACLDCDHYRDCLTAPYCPDNSANIPARSFNSSPATRDEWDDMINQYFSAIDRNPNSAWSSPPEMPNGYSEEDASDLSVIILNMPPPDFESLALKTEIIIKQFGDMDHLISKIFRDIVILCRRDEA